MAEGHSATDEKLHRSLQPLCVEMYENDTPGRGHAHGHAGQSTIEPAVAEYRHLVPKIRVTHTAVRISAGRWAEDHRKFNNRSCTSLYYIN